MTPPNTLVPSWIEGDEITFAGVLNGRAMTFGLDPLAAQWLLSQLALALATKAQRTSHEPDQLAEKPVCAGSTGHFDVCDAANIRGAHNE